MSINSIRFNLRTKEIEIEGSEPFIRENYFKILDLLIGSFQGRMTGVSRETVTADNEPQTPQKIEFPGVSEAYEQQLHYKQGIPEVRREPGVKRPPVRKYFNTLGKLIKSEDTSISRNRIVDAGQQRPEGISPASLKEKFGLSEQKIEEIIREAEKEGRIQKHPDGSYVWM